ncbi:hypothetical protein F2Q69_00060618 [Brassica cretica]|uniref:Uncharacterized protein n=1 Tax=Brassica cretica TaxID=69181 RepID=A0A8S9RBS7_BRACR|nr:hypothetical protein F2Q69_00060618 [Brassica cretica]
MSELSTQLEAATIKNEYQSQVEEISIIGLQFYCKGTRARSFLFQYLLCFCLLDQPYFQKTSKLRVAERVVAASDGAVRRVEVAEKVKELMEGEKGKELRRNVEVYGKKAKKALEEGVGSSWKNLKNLINEFCNNMGT